MMIFLALAVAAAPTERVVAIGDMLTVRVNGAPIQLRIDPAGTAMPLIDDAAAIRARLKPSMIGIGYAVGPQRVLGRTALVPVDLGVGPTKHRVGFTPRRFAAAVEGSIGPAGLPEPMVRFRLRAPLPNERTFTLPMGDQGGFAAQWGERFAIVTIAGSPMRIRFDPYHRRTLATAGAAVRLAAANAGTMTGATEKTEIAFGIDRPVRDMAFGTPLQIGPFAISRMGVRTSDFGSTAGVPTDYIDPDEVLVTAKRNHDPNADRINIGSDLLDRCSSILFDAAHKQIALTCA